MINVLIADDHAVVRAGLKQTIGETSDMIVTGEATDGWEVPEEVRKYKFHAVVLDLTMPGLGGLDLLKQIKTKSTQPLGLVECQKQTASASEWPAS